MSPNENTQQTSAKKPTLAELLARSLEDDAITVDDKDNEKERWDDDEGSFGG